MALSLDRVNGGRVVFTLAVSLGFGFVGGQIFPCIFIGICAGAIAHELIPSMPIALTAPVLMVAVPGAFCPLRFTLVSIVVITLSIGSNLAAPCFVASFVSYLVACGFGVVQNVIKASERRAAQERWREKQEQLLLRKYQQQQRWKQQSERQRRWQRKRQRQSCRQSFRRELRRCSAECSKA